MKATLGSQIDRLYQLDKDIRDANAEVTKLKRVRAKLEERLLRSFERQDIDGSRGKTAVAGIGTARFPTIKDRAKLDKYIKRHGAFDLLQGRINSRAYFDRLEEGESVPGVEIFERVRVSVTKRK